MRSTIKNLFRKPTPLEKAAKELGQLEHHLLEITAEISWGQNRLAYNKERADYLRNYIKTKTEAK